MSGPWAILSRRPKDPGPSIDAKTELLVWRVLAEHEGILSKLEARIVALEAAVGKASG
jgi:hypothetical protein